MNATEERQIKSALDRLIQQTPDLGPTPDDMFIRRKNDRSVGHPSPPSPQRPSQSSASGSSS